MKAIFTPEYGSPEVFVVREVPTPTVGSDQVRIDLEALAVTAGDRRLRSADFPGLTYVPGLLMSGVSRPRNAVQGTVFAGRISEVGDAVTNWSVGDAVFGLVMHGANAESMVVEATAPMARRPEGLSATDAVTLPYGAGTALHFLKDVADVRPGQRVLILGGSGGVGAYAVQVAKHLGGHVTATCSAAKMTAVAELGADRVLDYRETDLSALDETFDVVFDIADVAGVQVCRSLLGPTGIFLTPSVTFSVLGAMVSTLWSSQRVYTGVAVDDADGIEAIATLWSEGAIRPVLAERFDFPDVADAHRAVEARVGTGTVVVAVEGQSAS